MERQQWVSLGLKFITLIMIFSLFTAPALAVFNPMPIVVKVSAYSVPVSNLNVVITNVRTNERVIGTTNGNGEYLIDWSNTVLKAVEGDRFEIIVGEVTTKITFNGGLIPITKVDMTGECPTQNCPVTECKDTTCPKPIVCEEKVICEDTELPDKGILDSIIEMVLGLLVGTGIGLSIYKDKDGKLKFSVKSHRHYGRDYLHSIYRVHRSPITHGYGEIIPVYVNDKYVISKEYQLK
ncbi:MAG: hypothetical protein K0A90_00205 [Methanosarcinaceae archaeon]|nr:hypothetical protein [Methanosarcinaceae archaeon]